ncbi:MAG TPA: hypothetical protein VHE61_24030 [Opitutaceae bacterium]|nr:hypothetical protein [Opitutaceae bacterium]
MNSPILALRTASAIFGLIGLGHVIRILAATTVNIGGYAIGRRWSVLAVVVLAALCVWLWRVSSGVGKKNEPPAPTPAA